MSKASPTCPNCRLNDKAYKVSLLYLEGTARLHHKETVDQPELDSLLADLLPGDAPGLAQNQAVQRLVTALAPPEGQKQVSRRVHPDSVVVFFGLFALILLYQVAVTRPDQLAIIAVLYIAGLLAYVLARRSIVGRYGERVRQEQAETARIERAIGNWMRLYLCGRDQIVFDPQQERSTSLEQIDLLLE